MLVGAIEVVGDEPAHFECLAVIRVVVAGAERIGAQHDSALHFFAEAGDTGGAIHGVGVGCIDPKAIPHAVVSGKVAACLGRGDEVVGGEAVAERRHLHIDDGCASRTKRIECCLKTLGHIGVGAFG